MRYLIKILAAAALLVATPAGAISIDAWFGWNYLDHGSRTFVLTSVTYLGGSGVHTVAMPAFPGYTGMPDGPGFRATPTFTTVVPGGDGETTRTINSPLSIDWGATAAPFPEILIQQFSFEMPGISGVFTADFARSAAGWYAVGLIPPGSDTELRSNLPASQGDIYGRLAGVDSNPILTATVSSVPPGQNELPVGSTLDVVFAAKSVVPLPPAALLLSTALGLLGWLKRRQRM